jgi:hypothetical protein
MDKVKTKVKKSIDTNSLKRMMSLDQYDPVIVESKYESLYNHSINYYKIIMMFFKSNIVLSNLNVMRELNERNIDFYKVKSEFRITAIEKKYKIEHSKSKVKSMEDTSDYDSNQLIDTYKAMCEDPIIKEIISSYKILKSYEEQILKNDRDFFNSFIDPRMDLFCFGKFNMKELFNIGDNDNHKNFIMIIITKIFKISNEIYSLLTTPNIHVEKMFVMIDEICESTSREIKGVNKALTYLRESKDVMTENFNKYFITLKMTNNPSILLESFVENIKEKNDIKEDADVSKQFKKIVGHYKQKFNGINMKNSGINEIFKGFTGATDVVNDLVDVMLNPDENDVEIEFMEFENSNNGKKNIE